MSYSHDIRLARKGYKLLREGTYGSVWAHPRYKRLIKLCPDSRDGWPSYARFCMLHPAPWALKVYHVWRLKDGLTLAIMERCAGPIATHTDRNDECWNYHYTVRRALLRFMEGERIVDEMGPWLSCLRVFADDLFRYDLHAYNSLVRDNGSYVLADPLAHIEDSITADDIERALQRSRL